MRVSRPIALASLVLAGCATVPDVKYSYYQVGWKATVTVTQTIGCDASKQSLVILNTAATTPSYFADTKAPVRELLAKDLRGDFADSEFKITFTPDGRLKTINQSATGQGEAVVKALVTVVAAAAAVAAAPPFGGPPKPCDLIDQWGGGKPVTIVYEANVDASKLGTTVPLSAQPTNQAFYDQLKPHLPVLAATVGPAAPYSAGAAFRVPADGKSFGGILLKLQEINALTISVTAANPSTKTLIALDQATFLIPTATTYDLPIPKPPVFGKQVFELILTDAGAISSISYNKVDGTASGLNAVASVLNAETNITTAKTNAIKAQNDLIAAQQKAITCETKPADCK